MIVESPPTPGNTCATAYVMTPDQPEVFSLPGPGNYWWRLPAGVLGISYVRCEILSGSFAGVGAAGAYGPDCSSLTITGAWTLFGCADMGFTVATDDRWAFLGFTGGSGTIRLTMGFGLCP